jgi:hypothetical protein
MPACGGASFTPPESADDVSTLDVEALGHPPPMRPDTIRDSSDPDDDTGPARAAVSPVPFRIQDLPRVTLESMLEAGDAATPPQAGADGPELSVERRGQSAELRVVAPSRARTALTIGSTTSDSLKVRCAERHGKAGLRWEVLQPLANGNARWTIVDAWFSSPTCRARVVRRSSFEALALVPDVLYGVRLCDSDECNDPNLLLLAPPIATNSARVLGATAEKVQTWPFAKVQLPLAHGTGHSFLARVDEKTVLAWLGSKSPSWARPRRNVLLGVDVVQSVDEPEPLGLAHVSADVLLTNVINRHDESFHFHE